MQKSHLWLCLFRMFVPRMMIWIFLLSMSIPHLIHGHDLPEVTQWDYIVVGAGPAGLQMGYHLETAGRNYMVLEQSDVPGSFFTKYPRHDRLISINKRFTGKVNKEFNMRHDWNSILSHDESLLMRHYSKDIFPDRRALLRYLNDYHKKLNIKVQFNTTVSSILATKDPENRFLMQDQHDRIYSCKYLIIATGISKPNTPKFEGMEFTESYENVSTNAEDYEGQSVLILGRGNSAFELADSIYGSTNLVHMVARSRVRLSWATHYVGDLRAVNNGLLDTYQLKSLDGVLEAPVGDMRVTKQHDGKLIVGLIETDDESETDGENLESAFDNFALRDGYDRIIRCLGWTFDDSLFMNASSIERSNGRRSKYPRIYQDYQSVTYKHLYFAGTNTHSLDFRKSAGGFIHGFRYTVRALHHMLEWKNHGVAWPSVRAGVDQLIARIIKRVNEASGIYQMFSVLGDVIAINENGTEFYYFEAFPINLIHRFESYTGKSVRRVIVLVLEYGRDFSGPGKDIFRSDRATGEPAEAHTSNFLHPVFYYYSQLPQAKDMLNRARNEILPRPDRIHHIVEDFLTDFSAPVSHVLPLRRFIEHVLDRDIRQVFAQDCMRLMLTHVTVPQDCHLYLSGQGLQADAPSMQFIVSENLHL